MSLFIEPNAFDVIVVGTGLPESILAAAAASSGRKVLHLDADDFYGAEWASMNLDQLASCLKPPPNGISSRLDGEIHENELSEMRVYRDRRSHEEIHDYNVAELGPSRSYSFDVAGPKLAFAAGPLINLLLASGTSHYLEFKSIDATYIWRGDGFASAPASRTELFQDRSLSLTDKRQLARFLTGVRAYFSGDAEEGSTFTDDDLSLPFVEFLSRQQLSLAVISLILYAIAMLDEDQKEARAPVVAKEGLELLALHQASIGRFPNSTGAFLYPLYGQGELPQAFCRIAAVNGALYVLRKPVASVLISKDRGDYKGIRTSDGQLLYSDKLVVGGSFKLDEANSVVVQSRDPPTKVARLICVTDGSLHPTKTNMLVVFPPQSISPTVGNVVRILQLGSNTSVCPNGKFVLEISTLVSSGCSGKEVLQAVLDILVSTTGRDSSTCSFFQDGYSKPKVLWSGFYVSKVHDPQVVRDSIALCSSPGACLDYRTVVSSTEKMFHQLFGDEGWFTKVPDQPEEVEAND